jgi:hypothetical protein
MSKTKTLTPYILRKMIMEEKQKLIAESADKFLKQGDNKYDPFSKKSAKSGMKEVEASNFASTSKLLTKAKMLKEEERKITKRLKKIQEMKRVIRRKLLKDL